MEVVASMDHHYEDAHVLLIEDGCHPNALLPQLANTFRHDYGFEVNTFNTVAPPGATAPLTFRANLQTALSQVIAAAERGSARNLLIVLWTGRSARAAGTGTLEIW